MSIEISYAAMFSAINNLVQDNPDFIYAEDRRGERHDDKSWQWAAECYNVILNEETGEYVGSCLIGRALIDLGIDPLWFVNNDHEEAGADVVLDRLRRSGIITIPEDESSAVHTLTTRAQMAQDRGNTWSESLNYAANHVNAL